MIHAWHDEGLSNCEIGRRLRLAPTTVRLQLAKDKPPSLLARRVAPAVTSAKRRAIVKRRVRAGKLIQQRERRVVAVKRSRSTFTREVVLFPFGSPARVARQLAIEGFANCSVTTVRDDVKALGLRSYVRPKGPYMSEADKEARLKYCRRMLRRTIEYRESILFSDEKWFNTDASGLRCQYVPPGDRVLHLPTEQFPRKVMVWGCIGIGVKILVFHRRAGNDPDAVRFGPGRPAAGEVRPPKEPHKYTVTSQVYVERCLEELANRLGAAELKNRVFMQDGATCHTHKNSMEWLSNNGVRVLDWKAHSPDLNPIETLWAVLANRVALRGPVTEEHLERFLMAEWRLIKQSEIDELVRSFTGRLRKVVEAGGTVIKP
jgi:hypothetical protein